LAQRRCVGMTLKEKRDRFFADWVSSDTHLCLESRPICRPELSRLRTSQESKLIKGGMWMFGDDLEKVCRAPEQHNDWFSRGTAFVPEITKVVTITYWTAASVRNAAEK
jgi:hypothetical protein